MSDLRYALRTLTRSPGFASVTILSLALGIGANAAIYSVIRAVLLDPLPVRAPEELVAAGWNTGGARTRAILSINSTTYRDERSGLNYGSNRLLQRLDAIPGVESATMTDIVLISRLQNNWTFLVPGMEPKNVKFARIGPAYFETFGIPVLAGRVIGVQDHSRAPRVAVVNETAAHTLFGSEPAIGRRLTMQSDQPADFEVVGVVKDSRYTSPRDPMPPTIYLPYAQTTLGRLGPMNVVVRSAVPAAALGGLVRAAIADVDRRVPLMDLEAFGAREPILASGPLARGPRAHRGVHNQRVRR